MDITACNYDPLATADDGTCEFTSCLDLCGVGTYLQVGPCTIFNSLVNTFGNALGLPSNGTCPDGLGGDFANCNSEYMDCNGNVPAIDTFDCNGTCGGTAALDSCNVCAGGTTTLIPNADQDCDGVCGGTAYVDGNGDCCEDTDRDCAGVCDGSATCTGCTNPLDNATPTNYDVGNTTDDGSCEFNYCNSNIPPSLNSTILNYICEDAATFELCTEDPPGPTAAPCLSACPAGVPNTFLGSFPINPSACSIETRGCMDSGGTQMWGSVGPFVRSWNTQENPGAFGVGEATNYDPSYSNTTTITWVTVRRVVISCFPNSKCTWIFLGIPTPYKRSY
jgi:hypothetical protein